MLEVQSGKLCSVKKLLWCKKMHGPVFMQLFHIYSSLMSCRRQMNIHDSAPISWETGVKPIWIFMWCWWPIASHITFLHIFKASCILSHFHTCLTSPCPSHKYAWMLFVASNTAEEEHNISEGFDRDKHQHKAQLLLSWKKAKCMNNLKAGSCLWQWSYSRVNMLL